MKRFSSSRPALAALVTLGLGASTLLSGCFEKDKECSPSGSTCSTAAVVVDLSTTTGCGLVLKLADSTYVVPTGATWTNYHAKAGDKVLVGYTTAKKGSCTSGSGSTSNASCTAGPLVELGCISPNTTATTTTTTTTTTTSGGGAN